MSTLTSAHKLVHSRRFEWVITSVIVANAVVLGLETDPSLSATQGSLLNLLDRIFLSIFVVELALKMYVLRRSFFSNGWNVFDLTIVTIALIPSAGPLSILRTLRILRVLRLISVVRPLRRVVSAFIHSLSGLASVAAILMIVFYIGGVMSTKLFGSAFPDFFGTLERSLFSLFQIMTLESWSMGIVRPVMDIYPYAWAFFVPFILITTFAVLNLLIGIVVNSMQEVHEQEQRELKEHLRSQQASTELLDDRLEEVEDLLREMRDLLKRNDSPDDTNTRANS